MSLTTEQKAGNAAAERPELQTILDEIVASGITGITLRVRDESGEWTGAAGRSEIGADAKPPIDGHVRIGSNTKTFTAAARPATGRRRPSRARQAGGRVPSRVSTSTRESPCGCCCSTRAASSTSRASSIPMAPWSPAIPSTIAGREWVDARFTTYAPEELVRLALSKPARFEPGTDWSYSNTNYVIVRLIIEAITGRPVAGEMQRLIFEPLGLSEPAQPTSETGIAEPHAHAYYRYEQDGEERTVDVTEQNPSWISSGGDMISTSAGSCRPSSRRSRQGSCWGKSCGPRCARRGRRRSRGWATASVCSCRIWASTAR